MEWLRIWLYNEVFYRTWWKTLKTMAPLSKRDRIRLLHRFNKHFLSLPQFKNNKIFNMFIAFRPLASSYLMWGMKFSFESSMMPKNLFTEKGAGAFMGIKFKPVFVRPFRHFLETKLTCHLQTARLQDLKHICMSSTLDRKLLPVMMHRANLRNEKHTARHTSLKCAKFLA